MLQQLQQYLRDAASRGRTTEQVGPFLLTIQEGKDHPFMNYAIPDDGATPSAQDVAALAAAFEAHGRIPRLEYLDRSAPAVLAALEAGGFAVEGRLKAMTATAAAAVPVPDGFALVVPDDDADLAAMMAAQSAAFGGDGTVTHEEIARARTRQAAGALALAAREITTGTIVGGGNASPSEDSGFSEIGGIAVAEAFRRRGLASALTAEITRRALAGDVETAFLTPADDGAAQAYARAGYAEMGLMLHVRME